MLGLKAPRIRLQESCPLRDASSQRDHLDIVITTYRHTAEQLYQDPQLAQLSLLMYADSPSQSGRLAPDPIDQGDKPFPSAVFPHERAH